MDEPRKKWRAPISSTHVLEVRSIKAETEEAAMKKAPEAQFDDFNVHHIEVIVRGRRAGGGGLTAFRTATPRAASAPRD